jgi:putative transposase
MQEIKTNLNIAFRCTYHVVWCVKYRRKLLTGEVEAKLKEIASEVCLRRRRQIREMEADKDHFHILVDCDPQYGIHRLIKEIKGLSSRVLRKEFSYCRTRVPSLWTNSYFVATVGGAPLEVVKQYIENQKCY